MDKELDDFQKDWERIVDKASLDYYSLTMPERVWFNIQSLIIAVDDGGLASYYYNSEADYVFETIEDLRLMNMKDVVRILEKINHLFPNNSPSKDGQERNEVISKWPENHEQLLEVLNEEFYQYKGALEKALVNHIVKNKLSFSI